MPQIYQQFNSNSTESLHLKTSCWIKILKLQTLGNLLFITSHYLENVDNNNREKVSTTITATCVSIFLEIVVIFFSFFPHFPDSIG